MEKSLNDIYSQAERICNNYPELHRADVVAVLKDLQTRGAVALRPAINDLTIYLNNEKA